MLSSKFEQPRDRIKAIAETKRQNEFNSISEEENEDEVIPATFLSTKKEARDHL